MLPMRQKNQTTFLDSAVSLSNIAVSKHEYLRNIQKAAFKSQANHLESKYQFYIAEKFKDQQQVRAAFSMFRCLQRIKLKALYRCLQSFKHKSLMKNVSRDVNLQQKQIRSSEKLRKILRSIKQRDNKRGLQGCIKFVIRKNLNLAIQKLKENRSQSKKAEGLQILKRVCESSQKRAFIIALLKGENKQSRQENVGIRDNTFFNQLSSILHDNIFNGVQGEQLGSQKSPYSNSQIPQNQREHYKQLIRQKQNQINNLKRQLTQNGIQAERLKDCINKYQEKMNHLIWNSQDKVKEQSKQDSKKNSTSPHSSLSSSRNEKQRSSSQDLANDYCAASSTRKQTNKIKCCSIEDEEIGFQEKIKRIRGNHGRYFSQDIPDFQQSMSNQEATKVQHQMLSKFMRQLFELRQKMDIARQMCSQLQNKIDEGETAGSLFATFEGKNRSKSAQQKRILSQILKLLMPEDMITGQVGEAYGFQAI